MRGCLWWSECRVPGQKLSMAGGGDRDRPVGCGQRVGREISPWVSRETVFGKWNLLGTPHRCESRLPPRPPSASHPGPPHRGARPAQQGWRSERCLWRSQTGEPFTRHHPGLETPGHLEPSSCPGLCLATWPWLGHTGGPLIPTPWPGARAPPARLWSLPPLLLASVWLPDEADGP